MVYPSKITEYSTGQYYTDHRGIVREKKGLMAAREGKEAGIYSGANYQNTKRQNGSSSGSGIYDNARTQRESGKPHWMRDSEDSKKYRRKKTKAISGKKRYSFF